MPRPSIDLTWIPKNPSATLAAWESEYARAGDQPFDSIYRQLESAVTENEFGRLTELINRLARFAITAPQQAGVSPARFASTSGHLLQAAAAHPEAALCLINLYNIHACTHGNTTPLGDIAPWVASQDQTNLAMSHRISLGCAAIAVDNWDIAYRLAGLPDEPRTVPSYRSITSSNIVLSQVIRSRKNTSTPPSSDEATPLNHCFCMVRDWTARTANGEIDESAVLWIYRIIYHDAQHQPLHQVADATHTHLWALTSAFEARQIERDAEEAEYDRHFPRGDTLSRGRFVTEARLQAVPVPALWSGRDRVTDTPVFMSIDRHHDSESLADLTRDVSYSAPGILELAYVGDFDVHHTSEPGHYKCERHWAIVERVDRGAWLPSLLPDTQERARAIRMAIELAQSAGSILEEAQRRGIPLWGIRPEYMWAECRNDHWRVTSLSGRGAELFRRSHGERLGAPLFDRGYGSSSSPPRQRLEYALAVMIAEWAMCDHRRSLYWGIPGDWPSELLPQLPSPLSELLSSAIVPEASAPPGGLTGFLAELDRVATHF